MQCQVTNQHHNLHKNQNIPGALVMGKEIIKNNKVFYIYIITSILKDLETLDKFKHPHQFICRIPLPLLKQIIFINSSI